MLGRVRMVRGVQRVLMLPVMLLRAARLRLARVLLWAVRCAPGADGVRRVRPSGKIEK